MSLSNNPDWLKEMHHTKRMRVQQMADIAGVTYQAIKAGLKRYNIEVIKFPRESKPAYRKYNLNENYFKTIDTSEKAYWLGFILADGSVFNSDKKKPNQLRLGFCINPVDSDHLIKFSQAIESETPIRFAKSRAVQTKNHKGEDIVIRESERCTLDINCSKMCKDLLSHGVTKKKTLKEQVPIFPQEFTSHFIRGFFDGDGCFSLVKPKNRPNEYPKVFIGSGHVIIDYIIEQVKKHLDIDMGVSYQGKLKRCHLQNQEHIIAFMNWLYDDSTIHLSRKFDKYQDYLTKI